MNLELDIKNYDFVDFGASVGGSIEFAKQALGGKNGLGVDIDPNKVKKMQDAGLDAYCADFTKLPFPKKSVRFVIISHVLEHLPSLEIAKATVKQACNLATDFVFIQGPYYDGDEYLKKLVLKFFWSDWKAHTCHFKVKDMRDTLSELNITDYKIFMNKNVDDSMSPFIHPLNSPWNQHDYDSSVHPPKHLITFEKKLYREFVCYIKLRPDVENWDKIIKARKGVIEEHEE